MSSDIPIDEGALRPGLPHPIPERLLRLPRQRGYPVPWFVAQIDGVYDFRVIRPNGVQTAIAHALCWLCGERMNVPPFAYVIGPMCMVNRTSAEPPAHVECAMWAAIACPFLARPHARRRDHGKPAEAVKPAGEMITRNPGVSIVWETDLIIQRPVPNGLLFDVGRPRAMHAFREGRKATLEEVRASIDSGLHHLQEAAAAEGPEALAQLERQLHRADVQMIRMLT